MTEPLGTERIVVTPDTTAFRAKLEADVAAALASVQGQIKAAKVTSAGGATAGGVILPAGVRNVQNAVVAQKELVVSSGQAAAAQKELGTAVGATAAKENVAAAATERLAVANTSGAAAMQRQTREIQQAETSLGRLARGSVAAAAASSGIFRAISFASGAFLVGAVAGGAAAAALQEFSDSARTAAATAQIIESTGGAANVTAEQVERLATAQEHLTGTDNELVQSAQNVLLTFRGIRNEVGAGNQVFTRATKAVQDISTVLGTSLRSTAIQVGKALQDPVKGITALRRAGIGFTQEQRNTITTLVETGRTLEAQRLILAEVERQVGGTAEAIGRTLPGRLNILKESARDALGDYVKRLQESEDASKAAAAGGQVLSSAFDSLKASLSVIGPQLVSIGEGLGTATGTVGGPGAILAVVAAYKGLTLVVRTGTGAFALYGAATATAAQENLRLATAAGTATPLLRRQAAAATAAAEAEVAAGTAARRRIGTLSLLSGALAAGAVASGHFTTALALGSLSLGGFATRGLAAFRVARAGGAAMAVLSGATAALGGPLGIAALAASGLAAAIFLLHRRSQQATGTLKGLQNAINPLSKSLEHLQNVQERIASQSENITLGRLDVRDAERRKAAAEAALAASNAPEGSINRAGLEASAAKARDGLTEATRKLRVAENALDQSRREQRAIERTRPELIRQQTKATLDQIEGFRKAAAVNLSVPLSITGADTTKLDEQAAIRNRVEALKSAGDALTKLARSGDAAERALALPLKGVIDQLDRLPTQQEIKRTITLVAKGATIEEIFQALGIRPPKATGREAGTAAQDLAIELRAAGQRRIRGEQLILKPLAEEQQKRKALLRTAQDQVKAAQDSVLAAQDQVQASQESLVAARDQLAASKQAVGAAREQRVEAVRALADAREQARLSRQALNETVRDAKQAVRQAVNDAKGNLNQLAEAIGSTLNQVAGNVQRRGNLGETFRKLRAQILQSRGPEAQGAQAALGFRVNANAAQTTPANDFATRLTNLSDAFNFGRLKAPAFLREFNKVVKAIDPKVIRAQLGNLATDQLLANVRGVRAQVPLIRNGPRVPGGGLTADVVSPAQAQADAAKQIAAAQRDLKGSLRGIRDAQQGVVKADEGIQGAIKDVARAQVALGKSERDRARADRELAAARRRESAAEVKASTRLANVTEQHRLVMLQLIKVQAARNRLDRQKPGGKANQKTTNATTHGVLAAE